jgi:hypothetical protein
VSLRGAIIPASVRGKRIAPSRVGKLWKHFAMQTAMSGHDLPQSGKAGFSCGQHGISSAIAIACSADPIVIAAGLASGAVIMPTTARIGSNMRMVGQRFTPALSHIDRYLQRR